ncbi:tyrosine--tRNA ligase [Sphingobacterium bovistauri]|uniref:Tyrosine--tRNA ligase n=1 Tax=Sphingobacterium bovistauri TaxID=2781959 RepID=A0ABS7Z4Q8_9SPHI|nr:tyrosine--tRNA ligase [Sphingobacterium bovistauri]MCA5005134.1 tyrosine--tRNA ligase [Sphingobacterium bovistauri]
MNFVEELRWRGMLQDIMPGTEDLLNNEKVSGYIGFDPTGDSLHVGHLTQIMTLIHFQNAGHKPVALVGGATGMIGDPSFKSAERNLLDEATLQHNVNCLKNQLAKFLNFGDGENDAKMVNNYDWFKDFSFLDFIRDVGKLITVNYMMSKDSVKKRLEGDNGLSFTEFTYQLIQGYDFYYLWKHHNCKIQMGGSDQWGNIVTGSEMIRRQDQGTAYALTTQLIKKSDGQKFGKTESGAVWLDPKKTSPFKYYQFWLNATDDDAKNWINIFTLRSKEELEAIVAEHEAAPHLRIVQKALAEDITIRTHSKEAYETAVKTSEFLFGNGSLEFLGNLDHEAVLEVFDGVPQFTVSKAELEAGVNILDLLAVQTQVFASKGEAKKMLTGGGVSLNKVKLGDIEQTVTAADLINNKYLVAQKGKKNYFLIIAEDNLKAIYPDE